MALTFVIESTFYVLFPAIMSPVYPGTKKTGEQLAPGTWHLITSPLFEAALAGLSLACVVLAIRGLRREHESRPKWTALLVVAVLLFLQACGFGIWIHILSRQYSALGIK